jgi:hypothetical protein
MKGRGRKEEDSFLGVPGFQWWKMPTNRRQACFRLESKFLSEARLQEVDKRQEQALLGGPQDMWSQMIAV